MTTTLDQSCGKVRKNETAFPLYGATGSLWNRKTVFLLSSVMAEMRRPISCTSSVACWLQQSLVPGKKTWAGLLRKEKPIMWIWNCESDLVARGNSLGGADCRPYSSLHLRYHFSRFVQQSTKCLFMSSISLLWWI